MGDLRAVFFVNYWFFIKKEKCDAFRLFELIFGFIEYHNQQSPALSNHLSNKHKT